MDPEFKKRLLATYRAEATEHIETISRALLSLEEAREDEEPLKLIYREFHSLKGAARAVDEGAVETVCHRCEDLLSAVISGHLAMSQDLIERLHDTVVRLKRWHQASPEGKVAPPEEEVRRIVRNLESVRGAPSSGEKAASGSKPPDPEGPVPASGEEEPAPALSGKAGAVGTVRVPVERLESILYRAEEMIGLKEEGASRLTKLLSLNTRMAEWRAEWTKIQADTGRLRLVATEGAMELAMEGDPDFLRALGRVHRFLDWNREFIENLRTECRGLVTAAVSGQGFFEAEVDKLLEDTKEAVMVPFANELNALAVYIRELSGGSGSKKRVRMTIDGGEVEIDRRILEAMKDPFIHLVRNALDHGIENVEERQQAGKRPEGTIHFSVTPQGDGTVEVSIADDGRGIRVEDVRDKAVARGLLPGANAESIPAERIFDFLFEAHFSTRSDVSEMSGRGLGLSIAKENAERLGGRVSVTSAVGEGTTFSLVLPLTLARFRGVDVVSAGRLFVLPSAKIRRAGRVPRDEVRPIQGRNSIRFASRTLPLFSLREILGLAALEKEEAGANVKFVIIREGRAEFALEVDDLDEEREVVMKGLGPQLRQVRHIAGVSVRGSGKIVPIINLSDVARTVAGGAVAPGQAVRKAGPAAAARQRRLLVVEDSITARSLLKNILESAGFYVITARDGLEGWEKAQMENFDMLLTDIEMPRMDGIELTRHIRSDTRLSDKPVVILTALASRSDKERGMEAGATSYIVKSSFEESDLLDTVKNLLGDD